MEFSRHFTRRNRILVYRGAGGLGDILMHRMIFCDLKSLHSDLEVHFACPIQYHDALSDHPYIDKLVDSSKVEFSDYPIWFDTTTVCHRRESQSAPYSYDHRSDIWASHCGFQISNHSMHFRLSNKEKDFGFKLSRSIGARPIALAPFSALKSKNLDANQINEVVVGLEEMGFNPFILHDKIVDTTHKIIANLDLRQWMSLISSCHAMISVDTAAFHCAGGFGVPLVGVFSWADGKVYGKYFDFELVQKHRDNGWDCGPCYLHSRCPKSKLPRKPCITEITSREILESFLRLRINGAPLG